MTRDYRDYLQDLLDSIDESAAFTRGLTFENFSILLNREKFGRCFFHGLHLSLTAASRLPYDEFVHAGFDQANNREAYR